MSSLEWENLPSLPFGIENAQAVFVNETLYVGGGSTDHEAHDANLYCFKTRLGSDDCWMCIQTPTYLYALTSYNSHPVLVGGIETEYSSYKATNSIYFVIDGLIEEGLPPLKKERHSASAVSTDSLIAVAGGRNNHVILNSVEIFVKNDYQWITGCTLPIGLYDVKSFLIQNSWYLLGGEGCNNVCHISLNSLLSKNSQPSSWTFIANVPYQLSAWAACGGFPLSLGGQGTDCNCKNVSSIFAYLPDISSWQEVGELCIPLVNACVINLPTGELIVIGGEEEGGLLSQSVFKATVEGKCSNIV